LIWIKLWFSVRGGRRSLIEVPVMIALVILALAFQRSYFMPKERPG
jgi:ACR3 family arsenite efflux pump ArsB